MDQRLDIRYDWGFGVRNRIRDESSTLQWSREQVLDRNRVQIAMTRNRVLLITFNAPATGNTVSITHFSAVTDSDEDIADMLLMVLTFRAQRP